ncbi:MAG: polysaccharide biosynthesis protein, partial [Clostridia bacterium]
QPFVLTNALGVLYVSVITYLLVFLAFGIYNNLVSFSSIREYAICFFACMVSSLLVCMERSLFHFGGVNRQIFLAGVFAGVLCVGVRVVARIYHRHPIASRHQDRQSSKRLLIIGAGEAGNMFIRELINSDNSHYEIVGLIDDSPAKIGCRISGIKVLGARDSIRQVCKSKKVDTILFAIPSASGGVRKEILDICGTTGCHVRVLPGINELISNKRMIDHMRNVNVTDLLYRDPIRLNNKSIGGLIENRVVLVTGGGGSIGSELCRQIARFNPAQLLILDIYENNAYDIQQELKGLYPELNQRVIIASVRDRARLEEIFSLYRPSLVFHAAAHKHVPLMEDDPREAVKNNVFGTLNVAECADRYHADKFVLISTDKAVNPTNVMGATKRICEMLIQNLDKQSKTEYAAVRFGNVLGSNGSVIPLFQRQIASGGPVTVTHKEITRFFMTIPEAAQLVLQAATYAAGGEIFVLDMGEPVKIYDLAENLIKLSGFKPGRDIEIKVTGLRPGEKLYEELMMEEEGLKATQNEKIFITRPLEIDSETVQDGLKKLHEVVGQTDDLSVKQAIARMVTTYSIDLQGRARQADFQDQLDIMA